MPIVRLVIFLFLMSCTSPAYQNTTYGLEEFIIDSYPISQGKQPIPQLENQKTTPYFSDLFLPFEETILNGDELIIIVYCTQRPDRVYAVHRINETTGFQVCNGKIYLPHAISVEVEGLTLREAQEKVQTAFCQQLPHAQIFVRFKKRCERQVQIMGAKYALITIDGRMRLSEVLAKAKISPHANLFKSYVLRKEQQLPVDLYKLIHLGDSSQNIVMRGDDQIFIASENDATVMITGEVPKSLVIPIPYGFISLKEGLVMAGGISFTGNKGCIQIIRGNFIRPKIYCLDWQEAMYLSNQTLLLMPGDVVVVSERPITQWNRFINQLQPSASSMQTFSNLTQQFQTED